MVQAIIEFFYLVGLDKPAQRKVHQPVIWATPVEPFVMLNMGGNSLGNPGRAGVGGLLRDSSGE